MSEQQELKSFDPAKPCQTRNGLTVHIMPHFDKIIGFIFNDEGTALMAEWELDGKRKTVYKRKSGEKHQLDLVNIDG